MKPTTVYGDQYFQEVAKPHPDWVLATQLRRAHNRALRRRSRGQKPVDVPVSFDEQVTALSQGKATAKRVSAGSGFYHGEMRS